MIRIALIVVSLLGMNFFAKTHTTENIKASYQEKTDSRYCIVVGSFSSLEKAQKYGVLAQAKGYDVSYRDNGKGFYRVCVFDLASGAEAQKRIEELKPKDDIFKQCWVLKYDGDAVVPEKPEVAVKPAEKPRSVVPVPSVAKEEKKKVQEEKPKVTSVTPSVADTKVPDKKTGKEYAHYCVAVGSFATPGEAKTFGESVQKNGYGVFFRKDEKGSVLVCMYDLKTKADADKRIDKMRHIDGIFTKSWVFGYDNTAENLSIDQL
ncbi:MAG: hypothetical protein A2W90_24465 [Bacteroidetes bacterium GWF2_42_66]|nr:MAG: hypothetical protein A2W92_09135 [Bacteroidetes bacterium GWA2_42_15]OFX97918.1 MAG: hypothetical protein A2W89_07630 [Bacteroidetes bacterium GWE2_42_39]OFY45844.1 MAG: hypothetical protein A2W90_24465 [Bacteroidetes bacterium GWF2_42_66]HBL74654.1 hypothetical protein [Prolixibacteraceae bacterium]HCR89339.1 hypothetical protein [Prolixibacteraceae bacterium]